MGLLKVQYFIDLISTVFISFTVAPLFDRRKESPFRKFAAASSGSIPWKAIVTPSIRTTSIVTPSTRTTFIIVTPLIRPITRGRKVTIWRAWSRTWISSSLRRRPKRSGLITTTNHHILQHTVNIKVSLHSCLDKCKVSLKVRFYSTIHFCISELRNCDSLAFSIVPLVKLY